MEFHIGQNRIVLFPEDIEDEMLADRARPGTRIEFPNAKHGHAEEVEVVDKIVCLKVKIIKRKVEEKYLIITKQKDR